MDQQTTVDLLADIDTDAIQSYRRQRIQAQLAANDTAAILLFDPVYIRYATGSRNMQVWTMHNFCRYCFVANGGPTIMFEQHSARHLCGGLNTIDELRPAIAADYMMVGPRVKEMAHRWAVEIADLMHTHAGTGGRLAIDRFDVDTCESLESSGIALADGKHIMERARSIKSSEEISAFKRSLQTCEQAVSIMRAAITPGMRECEALALLLKESLARGGEYAETRLLTSGPRTNPWFQETSNRIMRAGELVSFDTDIIGPLGFYNDISRSWIVGELNPTDEQKQLYELSRRQLEHNISLLKVGTTFNEYVEKAYALPPQYLVNRYADVAHGCGMGVEYPLILYSEDKDAGAYDGMFEENMIVCVESYIGKDRGHEGVKLEQPVWISARGPIVLSEYPLEDFG